MKYFISTKEGPMIRSLGLNDSEAKYINIIDSLVAEMDEKEVKNLEDQGFVIDPDENYFIPQPIVAPHLQGIDYYPNMELDPKTVGAMQQMETSGIEKLREKGYFGSRDVYVGIADSGVDGEHADIKDNLKAFKDFVDPSNTTPTDPCGHGCISPEDLIYNSKYGLQNIESFFNSVDGINIPDEKSEIKDISFLDIKTISYDIDKKQTTINKILAVHKLFYEGPVYKVKTSISELILTPWHPLYILKNKDKKEIIKQRADNIELGDYVLLSSSNDKDLIEKNIKIILKSRYICKYCGRESRDGKSPQCEGCNKYKWYDNITYEYIELDEKLAFLCGLIFSNGHISKNKQCIRFFSNDIKLIELFESLVLDLFNITCKRVTDKRNNKCTESYFLNVDISEMFISIGLIEGSKSRTCDIPRNIYIPKKCYSVFYCRSYRRGWECR